MKAWSRQQQQQHDSRADQHTLAGLYGSGGGGGHGGHGGHHQSSAEADLISSYLSSQQAYLQQQQQGGGGGGLPYGVPIPPPLVPDDDESPLPPPRSTSSGPHGGGGKSRGKRSRHSGTTSSSYHHENPATTSRSSHKQQDIHYPKYDLGYDQQHYGGRDKYKDKDPYRGGGDHCQYTNKYGEDCSYTSSKQHHSSSSRDRDQGGSSSAYNKTWPKQHYVEDGGHQYTQDDQNVQYLQELEENARLIQQQQQEHVALAKYAQVNKSKKGRRDDHHGGGYQERSSHHYYDQQQGYHTGGRRSDQRDKSPLTDLPPPHQEKSYTQEQIQAARQAQEVVQCTKTDPTDQPDHKYLESTTAESKERQQQATAAAKTKEVKEVTIKEANPLEGGEPTSTSAGGNMETFKPSTGTLPRSGEIQLQQEQVQYVDNDCCQVAVAPTSTTAAPTAVAEQPPAAVAAAHDTTTATMSTATLKRSKGPKAAAAAAQQASNAATASQFNTLERNMAEVAERNRRSEQQLAASAAATLERGGTLSRPFTSCDTCDAPLTPASLAGIDHRDLEHRPLTRSVTRATMFDEPPERTSLFIVCSGLYGILLVVICATVLTAEIATHQVPLHYFEGFFTYLYMVSILFLLYVFCFLLHEASCCGSSPPAPGTMGRNTYFHRLFPRLGSTYTVSSALVDSSLDIRRVSLNSWNLPRDALPDGSPVREKLATLKRPKKYKTSENDFSHGSFFLRVGGIGFGLGTMIYNGMELGNFFEIPWNSPCYQVLRGINPILQMIFTFSQMYFVFMNARLNIHRFKFLSRFGLAHVVASDVCVWIRTLVKESNKEIALNRAKHGQGLSEDYMILEGYNSLRRKFGPDSFWVNGPYHAIMTALTPKDYEGGNPLSDFFGPSDQNAGMGPPDMMVTPSALRAEGMVAPNAAADPGIEPLRQATSSPFDSLVGVMAGAGGAGVQGGVVGGAGPSSVGVVPAGNPYYGGVGGGGFGYDDGVYRGGSGMGMGGVGGGYGMSHLPHNYSCNRQPIMGEIMTYTSPYLFPFVIEYSFIAAAVLFAMWKNIGKNPRYWGEEDDHISVASRKMTNYAKTDCIGASKGLFFGLLTLICGLICLILFFVLIDHNNEQVSQLAVFLADSSHCVILIVAVLATLLGFIRVQKMRFHGEDQSVLGSNLLMLSACGIFSYSTFNIIAGGLSVHNDMKNVLVFATGAITIPQVLLQLLFITDAQRRRISTSGQNTNKPGRQVVTFLLLCNLTMWVIYTFEMQKVDDSPVQVRFFGYNAWTVIQRATLPLCIFFRFHSTVILAEIWKNSYKTKLCD